MYEGDASAVRSSDEDFAIQRQVMFGKLPARIRPEDWIEETDTDPPAHELVPSMMIVYHPGLVYQR